jgi:EAL domain-containing protein (putative c-di-GMP-specific phosphodiesterase class I)
MSQDPDLSPLASWSWNPDTGIIALAVPEDSAALGLGGNWTLEGLRHVVDGLSASRLRQSFRPGEPGDTAEVINCALALPDGRRVQLIGGYLGPKEARGILIVEGQPPRASSRSALEDIAPLPLNPAFQPIFDARTRSLCGFEALARWGDGQAVDPRALEEAGLATAMLLQAAELAGTLHKSPGPGAAPHVGVNLTAMDLARPDLPDLVRSLREAHALPEGALVIELTEQAALRDWRQAMGAMQRLVEAGASIALDDFGAGHSSFAWLIEAPARSIKLDADLTRRAGSARADAVIDGVITMARCLGLSVTAEGIEDEATANALTQLGADRLQGFALGRPVSAAAAMALWSARTSPPPAS